jgi:hypothetical protein
MRFKSVIIYSFLALFFALPVSAEAPKPETLKPYILGSTSTGSVSAISAKTTAALKKQGFELVGSYKPFANAFVITVTNAELKAAAAKARHGGFGVVQRVSVTRVKDEIQVAYVNPVYLGTAYGLGKLPKTKQMLKDALGNQLSFGSEKGIEADDLKPGSYHYKMMMPYFHDIDVLNTFENHDTAVKAVEQNLAAGKGGTMKVYRVDIPGKQISVFGVGINKGDGIATGKKDTDKEITDIVDFKKYRHTAYLPYELMVTGNKVIALRGRYRIALHYPDTTMAGDHGFFEIMSSPKGIKNALKAVAGNK